MKNPFDTTAISLSVCGRKAEPVAVFLEHDAAVPAAMLGVLKAGKFYVVLDPSYPPERNRFGLEDSQTELVITNDRNLSLAASLCGDQCRLLILEEIDKRNWAAPPEVKNCADDLVYVLYTSGSTGKPKGVMHTHRSLLHNVMRQTNGRCICADDRIAMLFSYSFGPSSVNTFCALLNGAALFPFDLKDSGVLRFSDWLEREQITQFHAVPPVFRHFMDGLQPDRTFPRLRLIRLGGETVYRRDVEFFKRQFGEHCVFHIGMGTGETGQVLECFFDRETECPADPIPTGYAVEDIQVLLLDEHGQAVAPGVAGEIAVKSQFLSLGYWRRPELTKAVFLPDPEGGNERIYLTGDLGLRLPDGCVVHLGRKDNQVKIRGFRVEVGEIEAALLDISGVRSAVVVAREDRPGDKQLVAYVSLTGESPPTVQSLRSILRGKLPSYMAPSAIVVMDSFPLLPNGKVDRMGLPVPNQIRPEMESNFVAPRTPAEDLVARIWGEVLGVPRVGVEENFFDLGGHSLLATQVISRIGDAYRINLPPRLLFVFPTVAALARQVEALLRKQPDLIPPLLGHLLRDPELELSFGQERLWFLDQLEPGRSWYNVSWVFRLSGLLDVSALKQALDQLVERHEILRTRYESVEGRPIQIVGEARSVPLREVDLRGGANDERQQTLKRLVEEEADKAFDLSRDLMLRVLLVQEEERQWVLLLVTHHIASDGWSHGILTRELGHLYGALLERSIPDLPELPLQYADYASWQRRWLTGKALEKQLAFWKQKLGGGLPLIELPTDRPRPAIAGNHGGQVRFKLSPDLSRELRMLSRQQGVTLFMTLLAAFEVLLYRYTGQTDLVVGTPIAGRMRRELEGLIGFFVNTLVLRADLNGDPSFRELLGRVREMALGAYGHQELPFEKLVEEMQPERDMSRHPLFQVMFVMQNTPSHKLELKGLEVERLEVEVRTAKFDLTLAMTDRGEDLTGVVEYNSDLLDRETADRLAGHYQRLLEEVTGNPEERISRLNLLPEKERKQLLVEWNPAGMEHPSRACVVELMERQVAEHPEAVAVSCEEEALTYRELNRRANKLAHYLKALGVGPETLVGLCLVRSVNMVVGLLGILKAGGAYVPLDPSYPAERLKWMIEDAAVRVLLTQEELLGRFSLSSTQVVCLDRNWSEIGLYPEENPTSSIQPEQLAYVIYTSGSTGKPKGVMVSHCNLARLFLQTERWFSFGPQDVWTLFHSISFDFSVWELWGALIYGGRLVVVPYWLSREPNQFYQLLQREKVTVLNQTSSAFRQLMEVDATQEANQLTLRWVIFGGEALDFKTLRSWFDRHGDQSPSLVNMYGITETTVHVTFKHLSSKDTDQTRGSFIGRPIPDLRVYLLDSRMQPVPIGVAGEIYVGGQGVARGYLNQPELSAEKFVRNPFCPEPGARLYRTGDLGRYRPDGDIEFLGRVDHQVKLRGYRIELGEIETVLEGHPGVRASVVVMRGEGENRRLVAYIVAKQPPAPAVADLRQYLRRFLPDYMIPSLGVELETLPLTPNGKVDRKALPDPRPETGSKPREVTHPRTPVEELVAKIWAEVLGIDQLGVEDNFFELGGHSLLATQVISRLIKEFQVDLPVRSLFESPTVAELSLRILEQLTASHIDQEIVRVLEQLERSEAGDSHEVG